MPDITASVNQWVQKIFDHGKPLALFTKNIELFDILKDIYFWCKTPIELIFCVKKSLKNQPKCAFQNCSNNIEFSEKNRIYPVGCCKIHSQLITNPNIENRIVMSQESKDRRKKTMLDRYGVDSALKNKTFDEKRQHTLLSRYGVTAPIQNTSIKNKIRETCIDRYGTTNPMQHDSIKKKLRESNILKFGVPCSLQNVDVQNKKMETCEKRYGVKFPLQNELIREQVQTSTFAKYGVRHPFQSGEIQHRIASINGKKSKQEDELFYFFKDYSPVKSDRKLLGGKELDIVFHNQRVAVEFNGLYWHSEYKGKGMEYHRDKTVKCREMGYNLIQIFEDEWKNNKHEICNTIQYLLQPDIIKNEEIFIGDVDFEQLSNFKCINSELIKNMGGINVGFFHDGILVGGCTLFYMDSETVLLDAVVGDVSLHQEDIIEKLTNFIFSKPFVKNLIISVDNRLESSEKIEKHGFKLIGETPPLPHFFKGVDRHSFPTKLDTLFWDEYLNKHENNQYNTKHTIWDCGHTILKYTNSFSKQMDNS